MKIISILSLFLVRFAFADSMMLSPAELDAIGLAAAATKPEELTSGSPADNSKLRLDGIVFQGEKNWCIWLNGQRFVCGQHPSNFKIVKVCHDCVEMIAADGSESQAVPITLRPGL
jgi:hypothetical protein